MLGNIESLPDETEVNEYKLMELSSIFMDHCDDGETLEKELHLHSAQLLDNGNVNEAWKTLLSFNLG